VAVARSFFGKFFGRTIGDASSFAIGGAIEKTIDPVLQELTNTSWTATVASGIAMPLEASDAAAIVAEDVEARSWGLTQAHQGGHSTDQFDALVGEAQEAPAVSELFTLWRRGLVTDAQFTHGLRKAKLETLWDTPLKGLKSVLLSPSELANARQQGFIDAADQRSQAGQQGVAAGAADIQFELAGLPPGAAEAQSLLNRGLIDAAEFAQMIREGHTKSKYVGVLEQARAAVLHATDYAGLRIRGWITAEESYAGGALTGYSPAQMDQLFLNRGRPATPAQMFRAIRRGTANRADFDRAIKQSDIRPEYADQIWSAVPTYPPLFQISRLVGDGSISVATAVDWASKNGMAEDAIAALQASWSKGSSAGAKEATAANLRAEYEGLYISRAELLAALEKLGYSAGDAEDLANLGDAARVKSYRDRVVTAIYKAFLAHQLTDAQARAALSDDGIDGAAVGNLLTLWTRELNLTRHELTQAQIVAAYRRAVLTQAQALQELQDRGLSAADAATLLGSAQTPLSDKEVQDGFDSGALTRAQAVAALARSGHNDADIATLLTGHGPPRPDADILADFRAGRITRAEAAAELAKNSHSPSEIATLLG
jgi:hypothetical protein